MATESQFNILLWEIGIALLVEVAVLIAILLTVRKASDKMEKLADDIHRRTTPMLDSANALLTTAKPQIETIISNLTETSDKLKTQVDDVVDRTRLQVVRADELVTRTMNKVEETTDYVQHTVISPIRQLAGVISGVSMGFNVLFGRRGHNGHARHGNGTGSHDEMFV